MQFKILPVASLTCLLFAPVAANALGAPQHTASYTVRKGVQIRMVLKAIHPYLAEFDRIVVLIRPGYPPVSQKMFPDTGGYSTTNLFKCDSGTFMLVGYFDSWIVNTDMGYIEKGKCENSVYIGVFSGVDRHVWRFFSASQIPEQKLGATP